MKEAIANALTDTAEFAGLARFDTDHVVYSFAVRGEQVDLLGVVTVMARLSGTRTEGRPLQYVRQLVQPALECLRRELKLRSRLGSREHDLGIRERDLTLMLEMTSSSGAQGEPDEFQEAVDLLKRAGVNDWLVQWGA